MTNNLVSERKRSGLTREEVGRKINRSEAVIGKWERGESSPLLVPDAVNLARIYGCSVDYLAGLSTERTSIKR